MKLKKCILTAMLAGTAFVLNVCVSFPRMAPFQHLVNVVAAVFVGPGYAFFAALICGVLRVMLAGSGLGAITGAIFGATLAGLGYRKTGKLWAAFLGEVFGTGVIGAVVTCFAETQFLGMEMIPVYSYIPFYTPSAALGAGMGCVILLILKRAGVLTRMQRGLQAGRK